MNDLATALAPAFVAGFALQQLIDLLDPLLDKFLQPHKKWILSVVAIVLGLILNWFVYLLYAICSILGPAAR